MQDKDEDDILLSFCDIVPCSLVEVDRRFRGAYCLHHEGDESYEYSSFWWWRQYVPLKRRPNSTRLYVAISHKAIVFIVDDVRTWNLTQDKDALNRGQDHIPVYSILRCVCRHICWSKSLSVLDCQVKKIVIRLATFVLPACSKVLVYLTALRYRKSILTEILRGIRLPSAVIINALLPLVSIEFDPFKLELVSQVVPETPY
jgi:hypothetical protein